MLEAVIIYSSMLFGKLLHAAAKEEIQKWKKYIISAKKLLLILTSIALTYLLPELKIVIPIIVGFIIFSYFKSIYFLIGFAVVSSLLTTNSVLPLSFILLFILLYSSLSKFKTKEVISASIFFVIPFLFLFLETFIKANLSIFSGLAVGGLLAQLKGP